MRLNTVTGTPFGFAWSKTLGVGGLVTFLLCVAGCGPSAPSQSAKAKPTGMSEQLARWAGGNIGRFGDDERDKFMAYVEKTLMAKDEPENFFRSPSTIFLNEGDAYVWSFGSQASARYLILLNPHTGLTPSAEHAWAFVVDASGDVRNRSEFDIGWRMYSRHASYGTVDWLSTPVLVQEMEDGMNGQGPRKIYLGFDGQQPVVIRLEDASGNLHPMGYFAPNWVVGPKYDPPALGDLERVLMGENEIRRLEALLWLAGQHSRVSDNRAGYDHEAVAEQKRYAEAIDSPSIAKAIKQLRTDGNSYVRQLADEVPIGVGNWWG